MSYDLTMFDTGGGSIQTIELTRDEYISLKEQLARSRGQLDSDRPAAEVK